MHYNLQNYFPYSSISCLEDVSKTFSEKEVLLSLKRCDAVDGLDVKTCKTAASEVPNASMH